MLSLNVNTVIFAKLVLHRLQKSAFYLVTYVLLNLFGRCLMYSVLSTSGMFKVENSDIRSELSADFSLIELMFDL